MFKIKRLYRENYAGEEVISKLTYEDGRWHTESDWIGNQITNLYTSSHALVIGGGKTWQEGQFAFDMTHVTNHKAGLFGTNKLQTYGANGIYDKIIPDFLVVDNDHAEQAMLDDITSKTIVYAHAKKIIEFPGKFYLIPQDPPWNSGTLATYMACFDGHSKIFLMGFDCKEGEDTFYEKSMLELFTMYNDVDFVRVSPTVGYYMPDSWKYCPNVRQIDFRQFVLEADLG
jgi:hypothetical protein